MTTALDARIRDERTLAELGRDGQGFLLDVHDRHPGLVEAFAAEDRLEPTRERCEIIHYIRAYFEENLSLPEARPLLRHLHVIRGKDKATRRYRYQLFPRGYGQQACKFAGIRKPRKLMLDV